jgi:flagellar hook-length control protein FliK
MREAKPAVTADAGTLPSSKAAPLPAVAAMPETPQSTPGHTAAPAPQAGAGSAIHRSGTRASEAPTEIHTGKEESPVRISVPQVSESKSVPAGRTVAQQTAQMANPLTAIAETPPASLAATAVSRSTGFAAASHTSMPPASPPANAAAAFEQMDAAAPPQVLASSPHRLAVGIHDSGLGWVEIRTHAAAGQISAVLATGSNEARAAATAYLPEVRAYLAGQQVAVGHLSAETYSASSGDRGGPPDGKPGDSGTAHQAGATAGRSQENFADESVDEPLSYINVRV